MALTRADPSAWRIACNREPVIRALVALPEINGDAILKASIALGLRRSRIFALAALSSDAGDIPDGLQLDNAREFHCSIPALSIADASSIDHARLSSASDASLRRPYRAPDRHDGRRRPSPARHHVREHQSQVRLRRGGAASRFATLDAICADGRRRRDRRVTCKPDVACLPADGNHPFPQT